MSLDDDKAYYEDVHSYLDVQNLSAKEIDYLDIAPVQITAQISLTEYVERTIQMRLDRWQKDFCDRLQKAAETRHIEPFRGVVHAEPQLGKTTILSKCYPPWLFGHDPLFRLTLAMYNTRRSQTFADSVSQIMQTNLHKNIFPNKDGWLYTLTDTNRSKVSKEGWFTHARKERNDGQESFNPVGLQSGIVGKGFDLLIIDDPYRERKEAFSKIVRENLKGFYEFTIQNRSGLYGAIIGMFHRYNPDDFAGFLLDTGRFGYLRYATECDGDYIHESTGKRYPDPLNREDGELISPERRPAKYYEETRQNISVWLSMNQGRPSSEEGEFFNVGRITEIPAEQAAERRKECVAMVRAYDNAATDEAGAYTVGGLMGIRANGKVTIFDLFRERLDTGARLKQQEANARKDGAEVPLTVPQDPGAAGKDTIWFTQQKLKDFTVIATSTSGSKEDRALNFSHAVNVGDVEFVTAPWNKEARRELRDFPLSDYKDIVDALSDGYTFLYQTMTKGKIVTGYKPQRNLINYKQFSNMFPARNEKGQRVLKLPEEWKVYAGVKVAADSSLPTCGGIVARASANTNLDETLFIIGEYKEYDANYHNLFEWLERTLKVFCKRTDPENTTIWLHPGSVQFGPTIRQKLDVTIAEFKGDKWAGYAELNWYFIPGSDAHPVNAAERAARMYGLVKPGMEAVARDAEDKPSRLGLYSLRQEIHNCGFNDKGEPSAVCQLLDVLRMCVAGYATESTELTDHERFVRKVGEKAPKPDEFITPERQAEIRRAEREALRQMAIEDGVMDDPDVCPVCEGNEFAQRDGGVWYCTTCYPDSSR